MQCARHVRGRHADHKWLPRRIRSGLKITTLFPEAIPLPLDSLRLVRLGQCRHVGNRSHIRVLLLLDHIHLVYNKKTLPVKDEKGITRGTTLFRSIERSILTPCYIGHPRENSLPRKYSSGSQTTFAAFVPGKTLSPRSSLSFGRRIYSS